MIRLRHLVSIAAALALQSCAVGPTYVRPETPTSAAAPFMGGTSASVSPAMPERSWWHLYNDPVLDRLIDDALESNTDVRIAMANLDKARAQLRGAYSKRLPQTQFESSATDQRVPAWEVFPGAGREYWSVDTGFDVAYELDLFGRVRRTVQAARADSEATEARQQAVRVAVVSDTARAYLDALASSEQLSVAEHTLTLLDNAVRITTARFAAGLAQKLDVMRIEALRDQRRAALEPLEAQRERALFRLATLTGRTPRDLPDEVRSREKMPRISARIPIGDGRSLIRRRPDVRAAERRLAASTARTGIATAELYPQITFGGSAGWTTPNLGDYFGGGPFRWVWGPALSWSFPNFSAVRARIASARADTKAALAGFDGAVLTALQETETALSAYAREVERHADLVAARDEAERSTNIALARQRQGTIDFLTVLDAERTLADAESDLASSDARIAFAQIDLFRALAGGWGDPTQPDHSEIRPRADGISRSR
jgi:NodT family efflux transporter outer membrane factor (OMF) lipoprotein